MTKPHDAVGQVRQTVSPDDPPGGPLSSEAAEMLLAGLNDVRLGRAGTLDLALHDSPEE